MQLKVHRAADGFIVPTATVEVCGLRAPGTMVIHHPVTAGLRPRIGVIVAVDALTLDLSVLWNDWGRIDHAAINAEVERFVAAACAA